MKRGPRERRSVRLSNQTLIGSSGQTLRSRTAPRQQQPPEIVAGSARPGPMRPEQTAALAKWTDLEGIPRRTCATDYCPFRRSFWTATPGRRTTTFGVYCASKNPTPAFPSVVRDSSLQQQDSGRCPKGYCGDELLSAGRGFAPAPASADPSLPSPQPTLESERGRLCQRYPNQQQTEQQERGIVRRTRLPASIAASHP